MSKKNFFFVKVKFFLDLENFSAKKYFSATVSNTKTLRRRIAKFEHNIVYNNSSDEFDIGHGRVKVKVAV